MVESLYILPLNLICKIGPDFEGFILIFQELSRMNLELIMLTSLALRSKEWPITSGDAFIILPHSHRDRAGEDVQGELFYPAIPVALIELMAIYRMTEETSPLADFWSQCFIEASVASWSK